MPCEIFRPPSYALKYKDTRKYKREMRDYELQCKLWQIVREEPMNEAELATLEEYKIMKARWEKNAKSN